MPKISIIVPVYNVEKYLRKCLDSILAQTFSDFELFLVDDGSTDRSGEICDQYAQSDPRIRVIHQENAGQAVARNRALDVMQGEYVAFVDSDDFIHPQMMEVLLKHAERTNATISVCGYASADAETVQRYEEESFDPDVYSGKDFLRKCLLNNEDKKCWVLCDKLFHKSCFAQIRMPAGRVYEDNAVIYQILYEADLVADCDHMLYFHTENPSSTTHAAFGKKNMDWILVLEEMIDYFHDKPETEINDYLNKRYFRELEQYYLKAESISDAALCDQLKRKLKKQYLHEKKRYAISIKTDPALYNIIYPGYAGIYWKSKTLINKLLKR